MNFFSGDNFIQFVREVSPTCKLRLLRLKVEICKSDRIIN